MFLYLYIYIYVLCIKICISDEVVVAPLGLEGLRQGGHLHLCEAIHVDALAQVLAHLQVRILRLQEVEDLLLTTIL